MERIRQLRNDKGLSQAKLAVTAGMDPATLNRLEQGKGNPNLRTLERVADALEVEVADLLGKAQRRSSPEPSLFNGLEGERRGSKLPQVAEMLLNFGEMLLLTWEAELPARASADDVQWLQDIRLMWQQFGLINYGVLEELGADGVRDKEAWLARYMDVNAAVHRINAAVRDNIAVGASPDEEDAVLLKTLAAVK